MKIKFNTSPGYSIGIELEVQTISPRTGELLPGAVSILAELPGEVLFKPELFSSTIEINTPVCHSLKELHDNLQKNLTKLQEVARKSELEILISGCHPFANWQQQQISQHERYLNLLRRIQWPVRQFLIFGLHVHVGIDDADKALYVMSHLTHYIPHFIALSASSPFWNGFDTGLATSRIKIFEELPNAGIPYYFQNWEEYHELLRNLIRTNSIDTVRDIWWDIRPHPIFGTLEIRVCDAMPTVKENMALSSLIYLLVRKYSQDYEENKPRNQLPRWILEENKWRAVRYGLQAQIISNEAGETESLRESIEKTYQEMVEFAVQENIADAATYLAVIPEILEVGPSYVRQKNWIQRRPGDYKHIVDNLLIELHENRFIPE